MHNTKEEFERECHKLYQLDWMKKHGYGIMDFFNAIKSSIADQVSPEEDYVIDTPNKATSAMECAYEEFDESGFGNGSIFVCLDEFLDAEYQDVDYMADLFRGMPDEYTLREEYEKHSGNKLPMEKKPQDISIEINAGSIDS